MQTTLDATGTITANERPAESAQQEPLHKFSAEARRTLDLKAKELEAWVIAEARREANRRQEDSVSAWDVEIAVARLKEGAGGSLRELLLTLGGTLLGVSLSTLISIPVGTDPKIVPTIAAFTGIAAGALLAATWRKRR